MNAVAERMRHDFISRMRSAEPEGFTAQMNIIRSESNVLRVENGRIVCSYNPDIELRYIGEFADVGQIPFVRLGDVAAVDGRVLVAVEADIYVDTGFTTVIWEEVKADVQLPPGNLLNIPEEHFVIPERHTANFSMSGTVNWDILNELVRETDQWYEDRAKSEELDAFLGEFQIKEG